MKKVTFLAIYLYALLLTFECIYYKRNIKKTYKLHIITRFPIY
jgi:hypothetical protein